MVIEKWESPDALKAHAAAPHNAAYVAKTKNSSSVRNNSDSVLLNRQRESFFRVFVDGLADASHARRVCHRKVCASLQGHLRDDFNLAAYVHQKDAV